MSTIYLIDKNKLNDFINNVDGNILIKFKKIYHNLIKLLKKLTSMSYDVIGIINEYLMDIFVVELQQKIFKYSYTYSWRSHIHLTILSNDVNINFEPYDFNYMLCITIDASNNIIYSLLPDKKENIMKYYIYSRSHNKKWSDDDKISFERSSPYCESISDILLLFNAYCSKKIFKITNNDNVCSQYNDYNYEIYNRSSQLNLTFNIIDHKKLKNIISIFKILLPLVLKYYKLSFEI